MNQCDGCGADMDQNQDHGRGCRSAPDYTEQMRRIRENADIATVCLTVVSIHVQMPGIESFVVRALPWEFLDTCKNLRDAGAEMIFAYPGRGLESWQWFRPMRAGKARARRAVA